ncbi:hypothetical protein TI05_03625 [Achromatium sp. WMS3]|nr:hypothetical protein TI05_03625 [Achromatium sp. WMS3]
MLYRFFSIPALASEESEQLLNQFCAEHRIINTEKQFVNNGERSFWSICICYQPKNIASLPNNNIPKNKIDYREILNEQDFTIYAKLRNLRKEIAEQEGVPLYAIFSNEQLANMVRQRSIDLKSLSQIDGIGASKLEKYGNSFIHTLQIELQNLTNSKDPISNPKK